MEEVELRDEVSLLGVGRGEVEKLGWRVCRSPAERVASGPPTAGLRQAPVP